MPNLSTMRTKRYLSLIFASTTPFLIPTAAYQYYGDCAMFFTLKTPYERAAAWFDYFTKETISSHNKAWALANLTPKYKTVSGVLSILFKFVWSPALISTIALLSVYLLTTSEDTVYTYFSKLDSLD